MLMLAAFFILQIGLLNHIDNLWSIAAERADEAGKELAKVLLVQRCVIHPANCMTHPPVSPL